MPQTIKIREASAYGTTFLYPVCELAVKFTKLTGRKTFTHSDLITIESMGIEIVNVSNPKLA